MLARATEIYTADGPKSAIPEFRRALALFRAAKDRRGEAISLGRLGSATKAAGDVEAGIRLLTEALAIHRGMKNDVEEGKTLNNLGLAHYTAGNYSEARKLLDEALTLARRIGEPRLEAASLNNSGMVLDELGDYRGSLSRYERALALSRAQKFERSESDALGNIGGVHLLLGRYREAAAKYRESYALSERLGLKPGMSKDLGNLAASLLGAGDVAEAARVYERALQVAREAGLANDEADWQLGRGRALVRLGQYDQALQAYEAALKTYGHAGLAREEVDALLDRGDLFLSMGSDESAQRDFAKARERAAAIGYARGGTLALIALGDLESRRTRFPEAAAVYSQAIAASSAAGEQGLTADSRLQLSRALISMSRFSEAIVEAEQSRSLSRNSGAQIGEARALQVLASIARQQNRWDEALRFCEDGVTRIVGHSPDVRWRLAYERGRILEDTQRLEDAARFFREAVNTVEEIRERLQDERFRTGYLVDKREAYAALVRVLIRLGRADAALEAAEQLRSRSDLARLPDYDPADGRTKAATELRARIIKLQRELDSEAARPSAERRSEAITAFSDELAEAQRAYATEVGRGARAESIVGPRIHAGAAIRRRLPAATALMAYVVGEHESSLFMLTRNQISARVIPAGAKELTARVELLRDLLHRSDGNAWTRPAAALNDILMPAEVRRAGIRRVLVVPNGVLHYLPFAVLASDESGTELLIDRFEISYLPSASSIVDPGTVRTAPDELLALAPARSRLAHAAREVRQITRFHERHRALIGQEATETAFKQFARNFGVVHLATHGFFNQANPLFSGIDLESSGEDDGRLEVHEILRMRLRASLVTLSACGTALGVGQLSDVPPGDDFVGLTRAFIAAGSQAVLATLWDVNDEASVPLMEWFYERLGASGPHTALTHAQRAMRSRGGRFAHPYYWGAFVLVSPAPGRI